MALDWLYGRQFEDLSTGTHTLRSLLLEPDTVREVYEILAAEFAVATAYRHEQIGSMPIGMAPRIPVDMTTLDTASDWERQSLVLEGGPNEAPSLLWVRLMRDTGATIMINGTSAQFETLTRSGIPARELAHRLARKLNAEGRPRIAWKAHLQALPWVAGLAILSLWLWVAITERPPLSVLLLGSIAVAATIPVAAHFAALVRTRYQVWVPGNRIRSIGRTEIRQRRADNWTNAKVTAIVLPTGAVIGAIATVLIK